MTARRYTCRTCGAAYRGYAEYCNQCGGTEFDAVGPTPPEAAALRDNPTALWGLGLAWLTYLLYVVVAQRERDPSELFTWWLLGAGVSLVAGLVSQHPRGAALFTAVGACFFALAALLAG